MNRRVEVTTNTPFAETENIEIEEIVKQEPTYGPVMGCSLTARVNDIGEKIYFSKCGEKDIGMLVVMDGISVAWDVGEIRKGIRNCRKMETLKKI